MTETLPTIDELLRAIRIMALGDMGKMSGRIVWDAQEVHGRAYRSTTTVDYTDPYGGQLNMDDAMQIAYEMIDSGEIIAADYQGD